jgi:glutaminase
MSTEKLFNILKNRDNLVNISNVILKLQENGIIKDDPRMESIYKNIEILKTQQSDNLIIDYNDFTNILNENIFFINKVFSKELVIHNFCKLKSDIENIYREIICNKNGDVANYIPQLERVNPDKLGISICTVSGQRYSIGDYNEYFCVQSTCKPINYLISLEDFSSEEIHKYVGKEPSGSRFNALMLNEESKPHNPLINAGAIMICSLIKKHLEKIPGERFENILNSWNKAVGNIKKVSFSNATYLSEKKTADRNFALAYFMREINDNKKVGFPEGTDIIEVLELYFQCCSIEITCEMMSIIASTLANGGVCPLTDERIWDCNSVKNCLSLMASCGMYDYSGEFGFTMGFPAKSGVSGAIMIVIPGVMGMCTWSPRLDKYGNSVRGIEFCRCINKIYNFHQYNIFSEGSKEKDKDPRLDQKKENNENIHTACYLASEGELEQLQSLYIKGFNLNQGDYDGRTPLHLACCENKIEIVKFLLEKCNCDVNIFDRWENTPLDDSERQGNTEVTNYLLSREAKRNNEINVN